jgi:hypothetical protein
MPGKSKQTKVKQDVNLSLPDVEEGDYDNVVVVVRGAHKGKVGLYDDDDCNEKGDIRAIVYFDSPFEKREKCPYVLLPLPYLRQATKEQEQAWRKKNVPANTALAEMVGISPAQDSADQAVDALMGPATDDLHQRMLRNSHTGIELAMVILRKKDGSESCPYYNAEYGDGEGLSDAADFIKESSQFLAPGDTMFVVHLKSTLAHLMDFSSPSDPTPKN